MLHDVHCKTKQTPGRFDSAVLRICDIYIYNTYIYTCDMYCTLLYYIIVYQYRCKFAGPKRERLGSCLIFLLAAVLFGPGAW